MLRSMAVCLPSQSREDYAGELSRYLLALKATVAPVDLDVRYESGLYELGWSLYAFAGREGTR